MFQCGLLYWPVIYRPLSADGPGSQDTHTVTGAHTFQPHEERWVHTLTRTEPDHPVTALTTNPPATRLLYALTGVCGRVLFSGSTPTPVREQRRRGVRQCKVRFVWECCFKTLTCDPWAAPPSWTSGDKRRSDRGEDLNPCHHQMPWLMVVG